MLDMKVLLNDGLEKEGLKIFQEAGVETDTKKRDLVALVAEIGQFDALVVRSATKVTREVLEAGAKDKLKGAELAYKTLGLLGCGRIGQKVAQIAKRGFEMEIIGHDIKPCFESGIKFMTKEEVLAKADYISIHTGGKDIIIGAQELALMKPTAFIINTS